jgi:hypothetical protein
MNPWDIVGVILGSGVISTIIVTISERKKKKADAADVISEAAATLLQPLTNRVLALEKSEVEKDVLIKALQEEVTALKKSGVDKDGKISVLETKLKRRDQRVLELEGRVEYLQKELSMQYLENNRLQHVDAAKDGGPAHQQS